ncbi:hypothetical protein STAS_25828 [Striga asiatica]|uniref:Uncharacterized protein n=1 Tax=Striga asiatica TaxID=4170 RepID=A0A5A7QUC4_STRAF|nr:hypothetical protein STAS_25828 [Striga asiatica]
MSETSNVRLVRCPKCENLLPEVTDYSVYLCGGCGAVLEAKNKGVDLDAFSEKPDEQRNEGPKECKLSDRHEKVKKNSEKMMETSDSSESDVRSAISSSSRAERRTIFHNRGESRRTIVPRKDGKKNLDILEGELIQDVKRSHNLHRVKGSQDFEDLEIYHNENVQRLLHERNGDKQEIEGYDMDELLKQLDELKDRLTKSGNLVNKGKEKIRLHMNQIPMHNTYHDQKTYKGLHYPNQCSMPPHLMQRQESGSGGFYHVAPVPYHAPPPYNMYKSWPYLPNFSPHHPSCSYSDQYSNFPNAGRLNSSSVQTHVRWENLASGGRICRPIGWGAPFFTCSNCFELLLFPKNVRVDGNNGRKQKVTCGSCSAVVVFTVANNKLVFSSMVEPEDSCNNNVKVEKSVETTFLSNDYENSSYDGSSVSKDENGPLPRVGLSLQDHFEYSNKFHRGRRFGEESKSRFLETDKVVLEEQISRKESSATEIELSSNEYSNTGTTFDSGEASNEGDHLRGSNTAKMLLAGIGVSDSNRSNEDFEQEKANVIVNGHLIPARLIKKAEKLAGPVYPGNYWYDFRAGFWGVMGGPCLGIIPPFIEEFNHPMPEHCAGGNTNVFVNGRELNQKDLNLLVNRGLPKERERSYIIEISGRVLDDYTGEELESLGKLAPSVERMKHGFGMKPPKAVA